jgi:hypothetical protein
MMGFPELLHDQGLVHEVGSALLSETEFAAYRRYNSLLDLNRKSYLAAIANQAVLGVTVESDVTRPSLSIWFSSGASIAEQRQVLNSFQSISIDASTLEVTRDQRDEVWNEIRMEFLGVPLKRTPLKQLEAETGVKVFDAILGPDWRIHLVVGERVGEVTEWLGRYFASENQSSDMVRVRLGTEQRKKLFAPPRPSTVDNPRGGKAINGGACTTGPTVQRGVVVSILTAGHCAFDGNQLQIGGPTFQIGNTNATTQLSCDRCITPSQYDPNWWWGQGVDVALLNFPQTSANYPNGWDGPAWFVHQNPANQSFYDRQLGSTDPYTGQHLVCIEGASLFKLPPAGGGQFTSCGMSAGVTADDFRATTMYPGNPLCGGDSGALTRIPSPPNGSFVTGILSSTDGGIGNVYGSSQCEVSAGNGSNYLTAYISSFWKIHNYLQAYHGIQLWVRTW